MILNYISYHLLDLTSNQIGQLIMMVIFYLNHDLAVVAM